MVLQVAMETWKQQKNMENLYQDLPITPIRKSQVDLWQQKKLLSLKSFDLQKVFYVWHATQGVCFECLRGETIQYHSFFQFFLIYEM